MINWRLNFSQPLIDLTKRTLKKSLMMIQFVLTIAIEKKNVRRRLQSLLHNTTWNQIEVTRKIG